MAKVLIAEDDRDAGMLMQLVLRKAGHEVEVVTTGTAVLESCRNRPPDVLLLDLSIPEMDGYEVARTLKGSAGTNDIPILFVTGSTETHQKVAGLTLGANDYITKPFHRDELLARIGVALRIKRHADELKAANAELAALSVTDSLTGLYNRRYLDRRLTEETARARRHGSALSCLMVDVDRFKEINDRYGHIEGDHVLQVIAGVLRRSTRISDVIGRFGGEEFTVIAPGTDVAAAGVLAERIRTGIAEQAIEVGGEVVHVTVSIGIAQAERGWTSETILARADQALYAAKAAGRNCVMVWAASGPRAD